MDEPTPPNVFRPGEADVTLQVGRKAPFLQLAGFDDGFESLLSTVLGSSLSLSPIPYDRVIRLPNGSLFRTRPRRALVLGQQSEALKDLGQAARRAGLASLDLTHYWREATLVGSSAAPVMQRLVAVDFARDRFDEGRFVQADSRGIRLLVQRAPDTSQGKAVYFIYVPSTWATSFSEMLVEAAGSTPSEHI